VAAILANLAVFVLARAGEAGLGQEASLRLVVLFYTLTVLASGALCWILLPAGTLAEMPSAAPRTSTPRALLRIPALGWHAALLVCAYCGYKSLDYATLYLDAALAIDADEASRLFSLSAWLRPVAALAAGYLADRIGISRMVSALFAVGALATLALAAGVTASLGLVMIEFALVVLVVCGLRGIYFALLEEMRLPREITGTAIGFVSVIGYLPDVFFAPIAGRILDAAPGLPGFSRLYALLAALFVVGLFCSQALRRHTRGGG
jgi:MFS family permease